MQAVIKRSSVARRTLSLSLTLAVAGCASIGSPSKDEYKAIFTQVMQKSFNETQANNVCLPALFGFGEVKPEFIEINLDGNGALMTATTGRLSQLMALQSVGLLSRTDAERVVNNKPQRFATFRRTDKGALYYVNGTFCYARVELAEVVKWKGPVALGDYRAAWVY